MHETNSTNAPHASKSDASASDDADGRVDGASSDDQDDQSTLSFWQMFTSTLWAALGVQSKRNRERDFSRGKATHFILFGIGFTILFVLGMYTLVSLVLGGSA